MTSRVSEKKDDFPFDFPSYEDWLKVARKELEGVDPIEKLSIEKGDLLILPYYTETLPESINGPALKPSSNHYLGARSWLNTPKIQVTDQKQANEIALSYLNSGAEGILFDCVQEPIDPAILLNNISLADCYISFLVNEAAEKWLQNFQVFAENNFNKDEITGCIFWRIIPENYSDIAQDFSQWPQFYSLGIIIEKCEDATDEIAKALFTAVQLLNNFSKEKANAQIILNQISFSVSSGTDFFLEIARLKSLRSLWYQIRGAYELKNDKPLHIHANSTAWISDSFQPHGNMIKSTTSAMASIAGGCDSLTVEPEDHTNETMSRIARNVSSILREESHFSKVADPTAGSYYIESLTRQLSEKAWNKFQSMMKG